MIPHRWSAVACRDSGETHLPDLGEELADIVIYTMALAEMTGLDLDSEVERKILKNRARVYARDSCGVPIRVHEAALPAPDPAATDDRR